MNKFEKFRDKVAKDIQNCKNEKEFLGVVRTITLCFVSAVEENDAKKGVGE